MGNVSKGFLTALFSWIGVTILAVNYLGWSGGYADFASFSGGVKWGNGYYFGFQSLMAVTDDLDNIFGGDAVFNITGFIEALRNAGNQISFGLPRFIAALNSHENYLFILDFFLTFSFQPLWLIYELMVISMYVTAWIFQLTNVFFDCVAGTYNVQMITPLNWSDVVDSYGSSIRVFGQWSAIAVQSPLTASSCGV